MSRDDLSAARTPAAWSRGSRTLLAAALLLCLAGCFSETSVRMQPGDFVPISTAAFARHFPAAEQTRGWLRFAHASLQHLLPGEGHGALLSEQLRDASGRPVNVFAAFDEDPRRLHMILGNFRGLLHSAQGAGTRTHTGQLAPPWDDCEDVWIPVDDELELSARLGLARDGGVVRHADCIVLLPGVNGDNNVIRTRDLAEALRQAGFHTLAVELRSAGRTRHRFPNQGETFGVLETGDLLAVSEWLEALPFVDRTGLIGYCWGANIALLTAWEDCRADGDPSIPPRLRSYLRPRSGRPHFAAGILAFSPVLRFEELIDTLDSRRFSFWDNPALATLQQQLDDRARDSGYPPVDGSLRKLIELEIGKSPLDYPQAVADGLAYLRLVDYRGLRAPAKLQCARVPVLVVHAVNDPVGNAQAVADLLARVDNPRVAGLILPGGGHVGFAPYARSYMYSLMLNFFDPTHGAAAWPADRRGVLARSLLHLTPRRFAYPTPSLTR